MTDWDGIWEDLRGAKGGIPDLTLVRFVGRAGLKGKRILDIGSGTGANSYWLESQGCDVVAVDQSHACRAHWHGTAQDYFLHACSGHFDCIIDINTLCHDVDAEDVYNIAKNHLTPKGWLYIVCPTQHSDPRGLGKVIYRDVGAGKSFTRFASEWDLRKMLSGFDSVTIREHKEPAGDHLYTSSWCVEARK